MGFTIEDGVGSGVSARVDVDNRLRTFSVIEPEDKAENREGLVWSVYFTVTPVGAGDYFFYLDNTGTKDLAITDIRIMGAAADTITYEEVTGTPSYTSDTDLTPFPRNQGKATAPTATIKSDTDTTGLTSAGTHFFERIDTANKRYKLSTSSNIFIAPGTQFAMKAATGTALITCVVSLVEVNNI
jgi:hypothetical protein